MRLLSFKTLSLSKRVRLAADLLQEKSTVGHSVRMLFSPFLSLWEKSSVLVGSSFSFERGRRDDVVLG
jgi:hypothetical protein